MTYAATGRAPGYMGVGRRPMSSISWSANTLKDPLITASSAFSAIVITEASKLPVSKRKALITSVLNRVQPGTAAAAMRRKEQMLREGKSEDQATFDAMRLSIVNAIADRLVQAGKQAKAGRPVKKLGWYPWDPWSKSQELSGLGSVWSWIENAWNNVVEPAVCVAGAVAGTIVSPAAGAIQQGQAAIGCNAGQLRTQREIAQAQTEAARLQAEQTAAMERMQAAQLAAQARESGKMRTLLIAGGIGVAVLGVTAIILLR